MGYAIETVMAVVDPAVQLNSAGVKEGMSLYVISTTGDTFPLSFRPTGEIVLFAHPGLRFLAEPVLSGGERLEMTGKVINDSF